MICLQSHIHYSKGKCCYFIFKLAKPSPEFEEIYEKLKKSDVNLIIIGLGLDKESIPELIKLCRATKDGFIKPREIYI